MNLFQPNENDFSFILANAGRDILINGIAARALISNLKIKSDHNDKYISTLTEIKQGDRIEYNDLYWIIISEVNGQRYQKYKGVIRACNHIIGFKIDNNPVCIPVIAYGSSIGVIDNKFVSVPENKVILTIQKNEVTSKIKVNDSFVKWGRAYKIEGIDLTQPGLVHLHCSFVAQNNDTEFVCTKANDINYSPWYVVITGDAQLDPDKTYNYTAKVYDNNGIEQNYLKVVWSVSDGANSIIDQNGNLTTNVNDKFITIDARVEGTNIVGQLPVEIKSQTIAYSITGANEITKGYSVTYTANKLIDGVVDNTGVVFNFSIDYLGNSSSVATLTILNDNQCSIKANSAVYYITLIAQDVSTSEIVKKENIKLKNLF